MIAVAEAQEVVLKGRRLNDRDSFNSGDERRDAKPQRVSSETPLLRETQRRRFAA